MFNKNVKKAHIVLGNQLFKLDKNYKDKIIFMAESWDLCTYEKHHKNKIVLFLSAMRHFKEEHEKKGFKFAYYELEKDRTFETCLLDFIKKQKIKDFSILEIADKPFEKKIEKMFKQNKLDLTLLPNPMFLNSKKDFKDYLSKQKKPFMKTFYEQQRKQLGVLIDKDQKPEGGKWSYDSENRKKLPKNISSFNHYKVKNSPVVEKVITLVNSNFKNHPGTTEHFNFPVTRKGYEKVFDFFLHEKLQNFGDYQDAISNKDPFLYHSLISPGLNMGLLDPKDIVIKTEKWYEDGRTQSPLASVEGFLRQVIGWREFVKGIYDNFSDKQESTNFFNHKRKMKACWYDGTTGLPPLDDAIKKSLNHGYAHHIDRLMILSNVMLLSELDPKQVHKWFMEMFIDSSEWVMGPNVYGMGQFSDGGVFATKPYVSGSNYILKMTSDYKKGDWCDIWDGLYWRFIDKNKDFYKTNARMPFAVSTLEKMKSEKKERIFKCANDFIKSTTL